MSEVKPFASLSSGLLARKGAAKPAMRPQGYAQIGATLEDLGWNDMGPSEQNQGESDQAPPEHVPSSIAALTPAPGGKTQPVAVGTPPVVEQQRALEEHYAPEPAKVVPLPQPRPRAEAEPQPAAVQAKAKAAFTLRLDSDRHLKLRLACAVTRRSAQHIVTEALDDFLNSLPEIEALARQVPDSGRRAR